MTARLLFADVSTVADHEDGAVSCCARCRKFYDTPLAALLQYRKSKNRFDLPGMCDDCHTVNRAKHAVARDENEDSSQLSFLSLTTERTYGI